MTTLLFETTSTAHGGHAHKRFIDKMLSNPSNNGLREEYAKWLDSQDVRQAEYVRGEIDWITSPTVRTRRKLRRLTLLLDPLWVACVSRPPLGVCADLGPRLVPDIFDEDAISAEEFLEIEANLGYRLPADYKAFQWMFSDGRPIPADFRIPSFDYSEGHSEEVRYFFRISIDADSDFQENNEFWCGAKGSIAIGLNGEFSQFEPDIISMRLKGKRFGHVFVDQEDLSGRVRAHCVAPSFAAFLGMLTDHGPDYMKAIRSGDVSPLRHWLAAGGDPNSRYRCVSLLDHAILRRRPEAVRELLVHGAEGKDRLFFAKSVGHDEIVALLRSATR